MINLDRAPERLAFFAAEARKAGLAFERVAAVDGKAMDAGELEAQMSPDFQFQPINAGEAAVFLSHRKCWQRLVDSGENMALILEDDAVLADAIAPVLQAIGRFEQAFGIIRLETTGRRIVVEENHIDIMPGFQAHRQLTWHGGTAGYVIDREAATFLLNQTARVSDPVDQAMFHPHSRLFGRLSVHQCVPACVIQYDILHEGEDNGTLASTTGRKAGGYRLFRHGFLNDLRRIWIRHAERRLRRRLAMSAGNLSISVPFAGSTDKGE